MLYEPFKNLSLLRNEFMVVISTRNAQTKFLSQKLVLLHLAGFLGHSIVKLCQPYTLANRLYCTTIEYAAFCHFLIKVIML